MGKALSALATVTTIGAAAAIESEFWPVDKISGEEAARSLIDGVLLGSNLWLYNPSLLSAYSNSKLLMLSSTGDAMAPLSILSASPPPAQDPNDADRVVREPHTDGAAQSAGQLLGSQSSEHAGRGH